jgi:hypothetical protein
MYTRTRYAWNAAAVVALLVLFGSGCADDPKKDEPKKDEPKKDVPPVRAIIRVGPDGLLDPHDPDLAKLLEESTRLEKDRLTLGESLLKSLKENNLTPADAEHTVLALGRLRYEPAAEEVVARIGTTTKGHGRPIGLATLYPAIRAAWDLGQPAVAPLVKAYIARHVKAFGPNKEADRNPNVGSSLIPLIEYTLRNKKLYGLALAHIDDRLLSLERYLSDEPEAHALRHLKEVILKEDR